jgi:hypothetical protein
MAGSSNNPVSPPPVDAARLYAGPPPDRPNPKSPPFRPVRPMSTSELKDVLLYRLASALVEIAPPHIQHEISEVILELGKAVNKEIRSDDLW